MRIRPDKHHLPIYDRSGVLLVNKPKDWTSHDVVAFIRSRFNVLKCGHCGTLDPAATGLLVVVLGKFTKLSQKFSGEDKTYEGTILLGTETDSQDMDGNVIREGDWSAVTEAQLRDAFASFVGDIEQIPPMVSAVKKGGERLYDLARKGQEIEREPKPTTITVGMDSAWIGKTVEDIEKEYSVDVVLVKRKGKVSPAKRNFVIRQGDEVAYL